MLIRISAISVGRGRRRTTAKAVTDLAKSIAAIGLRTPITVLRLGQSYRLVVGRHRLEACRGLGWAEIEATVLEDVLTAQLWEIAENLHRTELTQLQRAVLVGKWIRLHGKQIKRDQSVQVGPIKSRRADGKGHRRQSGISAAARELGLSETTAKRAVAIARLTPTAQKVARELGLDNNQRALEQAAGADDQVAKLRAISARKQRQVQSRQERTEVAEALRKINSGEVPPVRNAQATFLRWLASLDVVERLEMRIFLLGVDMERLLKEADEAEERRRADRKALH